MKRPRKNCFCGRTVTRRYAHGNTKATVPHKCPHGLWCEAGTTNGHHAIWPTCTDCRGGLRQHHQHQENPMTTTATTTRMAPLPKEIRDAFTPDPRITHWTSRAPEKSRSAHGLYVISRAAMASIVLADLEYYRGHSHAGGYMHGTTVCIIVVHQGNVVWTEEGQVYRERGGWLLLGGLDDVPGGGGKANRGLDAEERADAVAEGEHRVHAKARAYMKDNVARAKKHIAKEAHEAKASTKLKHVRADIKRTESTLKKLRAQEKKLARQAVKENNV